MTSKPARRSKQEPTRQMAMAGLAGLVLGGLAMAIGLVFLVLLWLSPSNPDAARSFAAEGAGNMAGFVADLDTVLQQESVLAAARQVPDEAPEQTAAVVQALAEQGLADLMDVRVYPPRAEEIEVGSYPEPDFATVQMLIEARRRGVAQARLLLVGTADEHLAFARAVDDGAEDVAAIILVRMPADALLGLLQEPDSGAWVRVAQGSRIMRSLPADTAVTATLGRETVEGSALTIEWGVPAATGALTPVQSVLLVIFGLLLAVVGTLIRFGWLGRTLTGSQPARSPAASPVRASAGDKTMPPKPAPVSSPTVASETAVPKHASTSEESGEAKPDLPDWLLDEGGGLPFGDDSERSAEQSIGSKPADKPAEEPAQPAPTEASPGGLELEVPDLDQILAQIEDADQPEPTPKSGDEEPPAAAVAQIGDDLEFLTDSADPGADSDGLEDQQVAQESADDERAGAAEPDFGPGLEWRTDFDELAPESSQPEATDEPPVDSEEPTLTLDPGLDFDVDDPPRPADAPAAEAVPEPPAEQPVDEAPDEEARLLAIVEGSDLFAPSLFKRDGIRGVVDQTFDARRATELGRAIGTLAAGAGHRTIAVGRDGRVSGPVLMSALIRGLRNAGMDVIEVGAVPAPALWHAAFEMADGCGVMVSASHHAPVENGLQAMIGGLMLGREQLLQVAVLAIQKEFTDVEVEGGYTQENAARTYATALAETVELKRQLKVVVDCGNGIAGTIVPILFEALEIDLIPLYCDVDGSFPNHLPDPSDPECLEDLRLCVRNFRADLGFAFDGDGDRLALVTNDSKVAGADQVLMLLAGALHTEDSSARVVLDARSAGRLRQTIQAAGGKAILAPGGSVPVARSVVEEEAALGGAIDGQFIVARRWYPFGDAICAAVRLLELLAADRRGVQERLDELPELRTTGALPIAVDAEHGRRLIAGLRSTVDFGDDAELTTIDGMRIDFSDRWGLLRVNVDDGTVELRLGGHDAAALNRMKSEFRDWLLAVDPNLPMPY